MHIDFSEIKETVLPQFYGGEQELTARMISDGAVRLLRGQLLPGASIGSHCHEIGCEVIYILEGRGCVLCDGAHEVLKAGDCHYCPTGHTHSLVNDSDEMLVFFAVVTLA